MPCEVARYVLLYVYFLAFQLPSYLGTTAIKESFYVRSTLGTTIGTQNTYIAMITHSNQALSMYVDAVGVLRGREGMGKGKGMGWDACHSRR